MLSPLCVFEFVFFFFKLQLLGRQIHSDKRLGLIACTEVSLALTTERNRLTQEHVTQVGGSPENFA